MNHKGSSVDVRAQILEGAKPERRGPVHVRPDVYSGPRSPDLQNQEGESKHPEALSADGLHF